MQHSWALAAVATAFLVPAAVSATEAKPLAKIAQGKLVGARDGTVDRFLNIPFAAAPVGGLRWRAPQAALEWTGVRDAATLGPACPQKIRPALVAGGIADSQSEDCLQLNIWRPKGARKLPVMVWIHGGAHVVGSGTFPVFDATALARQGVILVTVNYRLGALGYFAHPALTADARRSEPIGNYGLMDQLAALRWVKANITAFGGDPKQVTLFGESAGAIGVTTLLANSEGKGLFARAIVQSGIALADPPNLEAEEARGIALAGRAGAGRAATLSELRALPIEALIAAADTNAAGAMFGPFIDGKLLHEAPWRTFARGEPIDVPLLVGANSNEASVILAMGVRPASALAYLGADTGAGRAAYGTDLGDEELARQVLGDAWFVAPARWLAERMQNGEPSYLYHFAYVAEGRRDKAKGAAHGSELPYIFGTLDYLASFAGPVSEADRRFGTMISACWVAFAKGGAPRCALAPGWPRYSSSDDRLALFAPQSGTAANFRKAQIDHLLKVRFKQVEPAR